MSRAVVEQRDKVRKGWRIVDEGVIPHRIPIKHLILWIYFFSLTGYTRTQSYAFTIMIYHIFIFLFSLALAPLVSYPEF